MTCVEDSVVARVLVGNVSEERSGVKDNEVTKVVSREYGVSMVSTIGSGVVAPGTPVDEVEVCVVVVVSKI